MLRQFTLFVVAATSVLAQKPQSSAVPASQAPQAQQATQQREAPQQAPQAQQPQQQTQAAVVKSRSNVRNNIVLESDGRLRCITPQGTACPAKDIDELFASINTTRSNIKKLTLASPDGILQCQTVDGKACTATHATELNAQITKNYDLKSSKIGRVGGTITKQ